MRILIENKNCLKATYIMGNFFLIRKMTGWITPCDSKSIHIFDEVSPRNKVKF